MSLPEVLMWHVLRARPEGLKFRRQHPIGGWVADFYCDAARMVIEIDGISHEMGNRPAKDQERDAILGRQGLRVLRIPAAEVLQDPLLAAQTIVRACQAAPPPSAADAAATSPGGGGSIGIDLVPGSTTEAVRATCKA
jgi:very-short-patch-repair endonuclease